MADKKCKYCGIKYDEFHIFELRYEGSGKKYKFCDGTPTNCMLTEPWWNNPEPPDDEDEKEKKNKG